MLINVRKTSVKRLRSNVHKHAVLILQTDVHLITTRVFYLPFTRVILCQFCLMKDKGLRNKKQMSNVK